MQPRTLGGTSDPPALAVQEIQRDLWVGVDHHVPIAGGDRRAYVNFDNAASTPAMRVVRDEVDRFLEWYSSVHRGSGFKSRLATTVYEEARSLVGSFVGADPALDVVVFTKHTTESINVAAASLGLSADDVVVVSAMEHHANQLPWRRTATVEFAELDTVGQVDLGSLEAVLRRHAGRAKLVALTGASNVTGIVNPIYDAARLAHRFGARILIDAAQLVAHRRVDMRAHDDPDHLDFVAFSGHKMYAPYGAGALVGPRSILDAGEPFIAGGGAVTVVTRDSVAWTDAPDRHEAGSPNVIGAVAMAVASKEINRLGFDAIHRAEVGLMDRFIRGIEAMPGVRSLGGGRNPESPPRIGVIPFTVAGVHHGRVAAILGAEWGIGVRSGCFCAHPYVLDLLGVTADRAEEVRRRLVAGDRADTPGAVRVSFAPFNRPDEVDHLLAGLDAVASGRTSLEYAQDQRTGDFDPVGWAAGWSDVFSIGESP